MRGLGTLVSGDVHVREEGQLERDEGQEKVDGQTLIRLQEGRVVHGVPTSVRGSKGVVVAEGYQVKMKSESDS